MRELPDLTVEKKALEACGVPPGAQLAAYMKILLEWNEKINLTGARDVQELATKHIADVWNAVQALGGVGQQVADIGSGGGIPGIILGIISPETNVTLIERRQKKARTVASMVSHLELDERVKVVPRSFEEVTTLRPDTELWFRGVMPGPKLAVYLSEFFPRGSLGQLFLMKGPAWPQEKLEIMNQPKVKERWLERFASAAEVPYELPGGAGERMIVIV